MNTKFNVDFVEYQIYFTRKAEFCDIFTRAKQNSVTFSLVLSTRENITEFCLTSEINLIFNKTTMTILYIL